MPSGLSEGLGGTWAGLVDRREFRERLAQTTIARARLRGATEVEPVDLHGAVHSLIGAIQRVRAWAHEGRGPLTRLVDRTEGGRHPAPAGARSVGGNPSRWDLPGGGGHGGRPGGDDLERRERAGTAPDPGRPLPESIRTVPHRVIPNVPADSVRLIPCLRIDRAC